MTNDGTLLLDPWRPFKSDQVRAAVAFCGSLLGTHLTPEVASLNLRTHEEWGQNYESTSADLESLWSETQPIVMGYELPPSVVRGLVHAGKPFLSLAVHYVRFLPDLLVSVRTNITDLDEILHAEGVSEDLIFDCADRLINSLKSPDLEGKFSGDWIVEQLPLDASTIKDKSFLGQVDVQEYFCLDRFRVLHHPHSRVRSISGLRHSSYSMMANGDVSMRFYGVSSSLTYEAKYFGREASRIIDHWGRQQIFGTTEYVLEMRAIERLAKYLSGGRALPMNRPDTVKRCLGFDWSR